MLVIVVLVTICGASAEYRCTDKNVTSMTFKPTEDGVMGRYKAELCTLRNPKVTQWKIELMMHNNSKCEELGSRRYVKPGKTHSVNRVEINDTPNCNYVCYSMNFDLIFSSCYNIKSTLKVDEVNRPPYDTYLFVNNNLTLDYFTKNTPYVNIVNHEDDVSLTWYLGLPATKYDITLYPKCNATDTASANETCDPAKPTSVPITCQSDEVHRELVCSLAPPHDCYRAILEHRAPWTGGEDFMKMQIIEYPFCHSAAAAPRVAGGGGGAPAWAALGGALLALALLAALAARRLRHRGYFKRVQQQWLHRREGEAAAAQRGARPVLLLHAREAEHGQRVARLLLRLLQQATSAPVYDLFSPSVVARAARAPHEWVRGVLGSPDVAVVLLQTPALAALYRDRFDNLDVGAPLLGQQLMYRAPVFGDSLLQFALRLISQDVRAMHDYRKYYLVQLSELPVDIFPQLVSYRRYSLPELSEALLSDAAQLPAEPQLLAELADAVRAFAQHATDHPDYLNDELLSIA